MTSVKTWMIVFTLNKKRLDNYNKIKKITNCELFEAIDTINNYPIYKNLALNMKLTTQPYLDKYRHLPGKLGCNMSHQLLLLTIAKRNTKWNLVLEDDVSINNFNINKINNVIQMAEKNNSHYVQLVTHHQYINRQKRSKYIGNNLYKMIPQYHTTAYLIDNIGAKKVIDRFPINKNIDLAYGEYIRDLNSLCWINDIFVNSGSKDAVELKSEFGSLIWENHK